MQRFLFDLCAQLTDGSVERRSPWISDEWLARELAADANLDRLVNLPEGPDGSLERHPLPYEE